MDRLPVCQTPTGFLQPLKRFTDVAAVGVANVVTESSGTARFFPMLFRSGDRIETSLPLRVAAVASGENPGIEANRLSVGGRSIRTDIGHALPINFYGPRGTIRTISAADVLNGRLARDSVHERVVVVGATVSGGGDVFPSPFDPVLPGVEIISTAIAHLMTGDGLVRDRDVRLADAGLAVVLTMVVVGLLAWRRSAIGFGAIVGVVLIWLGVNVVAFWNGIWLSVALPMAAAAPPAILFGVSSDLAKQAAGTRFRKTKRVAATVSSAGPWGMAGPAPRLPRRTRPRECGDCVYRSVRLHRIERNTRDRQPLVSC